MTRYTCMLALLAMALTVPLFAQGNGAKKDIDYKAPKDPLRTCINPDTQKDPRAGRDELILDRKSIGNNPQEGQYRESMEHLLKLEIKNVRTAIQDVQHKHAELIELYPTLTSYQEIILEDVPGAWREGQYVNSRRVLSMIFNDRHEMKCVVLDSFTRAVYNPQSWTRKIIRLYYPNVQTMELETKRHNYRMHGTLENASPEIQLRALRMTYLNLRTALYSMDMMIAAYYDLRNKKNEWQVNM